MIHRALFGSYERFIGIMLEHYAASCPVLTPVQAIVLPVSDRFNGYGKPSPMSCAAPAHVSSWTIAASRSGARSARRSCARSPSCSSWAIARRREDRLCARASRGDTGNASVQDFGKRLLGSYTPPR